jgi:hypothetical protein
MYQKYIVISNKSRHLNVKMLKINLNFRIAKASLFLLLEN